MTTYHYIQVGSSDLKRAIDTGNKQEAKKIFEETTKRYEALYPAADRAWFADCALRFYNKANV